MLFSQREQEDVMKEDVMKEEDIKLFKDFQQELRYTNREMAEFLGVCKLTISNWRRGERPISEMCMKYISVMMWLRRERILNPYILV